MAFFDFVQIISSAMEMGNFFFIPTIGRGIFMEQARLDLLILSSTIDSFDLWMRMELALSIITFSSIPDRLDGWIRATSWSLFSLQFAQNERI